MREGPEWFAPKRYGYGAGSPISWQGWALTIVYVAVVAAFAVLLRDKPYALVAAVVPLTLLLTIIAAKTTRGGWKWRWGGED